VVTQINQGDTRWATQQASVEQDLEKLMELVKEITRFLDEKQERLRPTPPKTED
jgi:hypothetical protein